MIHWLSLAQNGQQPEFTIWPFLILMVIIFLLFQLIMGSPQRREQRRREELLKTLKKNDRVVTIGGIMGTVASVVPEKNEVTLKVDENTRIKMRLNAIHEVLRDEQEESAGK